MKKIFNKKKGLSSAKAIWLDILEGIEHKAAECNILIMERDTLKCENEELKSKVETLNEKIKVTQENEKSIILSP